MKHLSLLFFLVGLSVSALAQEVVIDTNYYTPPSQRRRVLTADPEDNYNRQPKRSTRLYKTDNELFRQLKEVQTWYASAEGGFRSDVSMLDNSFSGLVRNATQTKANWSVLLGYTFRNAWAAELGYAQAPVHLNITIANGANPLVYTYQNSGNGIPLRLKRRIGSGKRSDNGTGFWLTAGAWLVPNGNVQMDDFRLIGYISRNRGSRTDTLRLTNATVTSSRITGLAEAGIDYSARLSPFFELGAYVRKYWGLGTALRSDLLYTVNNTSEQRAVVTADGSGWGFGIILRYVYGRRHELKHNRVD
ncbi:hypothetical protein [Spirosoma sp. KNUC1025]|uniref:hypothetical protein n=1 Tax=Spirosoma sp. KNUC1025 TaxID=2894082 RepID=UPI00386CDE58|nr:hypothetical protein LN737_29200 [Spirosoma sp. KNUC1025]